MKTNRTNQGESDPSRGGKSIALKQLTMMESEARKEAAVIESMRRGSVEAAFLRGKAEGLAEASAVVRTQIGS